MHTRQISPPAAQRGAVLLVGLVVLLVLTIIGLHASRSSTLGLIAATNSQEAMLALAAAEESAVAGERRIVAVFGGAAPGDLATDANDEFYAEGGIDLDTFDWDQQLGIGREFDPAGNLLAEYVVEYLGEGEDDAGSIAIGGASTTNQLYRISGRGLGARGTQRIVQTIFAVQD